MMAGAVKAIDKRSVHQICSGQVVLNLATAIKELVENSLDAGATNIEIKLKEYGSESIEVSDNGSGVEESNFAGLTLKHHTSKLHDFSDLSTVDTFGFRGEALSSLCALSDLSVVTCHKSVAVGTRLTYDHDGNIVKQVPCARQQGTTVTLQNLFSTLPVRHREFLRNVKKEFAKMVQVLQAYCIIASGVKLTCTNQPDKGKKSLVVSTSGTATMRESITNVFGSKQLQSLLEFSQHTPGTELCEEYGLKPQQFEKIPFSISGFVSKSDHGQGRSTGDRQFLFINRRPCDFPKVSKLINEVYHMYNRHQYPFIVLDISLAKDAVDVNVTPDKRKVLVQEEKTLLAILKASLQAMFEPRSSSYDVNQKPMAAVTPSSASLAAMFGHSPSSGNSDPASNRDRKQGVKLNLSNLKRSFAHANHPDDEQMDKRAKQPKLDSFFFKSPDPSRKNPTDEDDAQNGPITDAETTENDRTLPAETHHEQQSSLDATHEQSSLHTSGEMLSVNADRGRLSLDTNGDMSTCKADSSLPGMNSEPNCTITFENGRTETDAVDDDVHPLEIASHSLSVSSVEGPSEVRESGQREKPIPDSSEALQAEALSLGEQSRGEGSPEEQSQQEPLSGHSMGDGSQKSSVARSDSESGFCDSSPSIGGSAGITESSEQSTDHGSEGMEDDSRSLGLSDEKGFQQGNKRIIHRLDEVAPKSDLKRREVTIPLSMAGLKRVQENRESEKGERAMGSRAFRAKIAPSDNASAEEELQREISKDMFSKMEILGQFNLGFIITRLGQDLFIIDQHATDEKYNFETLQKETVLQGQKLIQPMQLELTAVNESILMDNLEIFKKNGFDFNIDEDGVPTQRIKLVSQPTSRNWTFGKDDIDELIFMLSDAPGVLCRPTRVRQMFASRACRKSIMIGTALTKADMKKLVCHMGELDQPWNCPHGRPTMRHLFNLNMIPD